MNDVFKGFKDKVKKYLKTNFPFEGVEFFDVTLRREKGGNTLRVTVDGEDVDLDKCAEVSRFVSHFLDSEEMGLNGRYILEVSTPGLDRPLKNENDFKRFKGRVCKIVLKEPVLDSRKNFRGEIVEVQSGKVIIFVKDENNSFEIEIKNIKKSTLDIDV